MEVNIMSLVFLGVLYLLHVILLSLDKKRLAGKIKDLHQRSFMKDTDSIQDTLMRMKVNEERKKEFEDLKEKYSKLKTDNENKKSHIINLSNLTHRLRRNFLMRDIEMSYCTGKCEKLESDYAKSLEVIVTLTDTLKKLAN